LAACTAVIKLPLSKSQMIKALDHRGLDYQASGQYQRAVDDFSAVIRLGPTVAGYYDNRQTAYRALGQLDAALTDANTAVRLAPQAAFVYHSRATVLAALGRFDDAVADYDRAIAIDPRPPFRYFDKATALRRLARNSDAIATLTAGLSQTPGDRLLLKTRGMTELSSGQVAAAAQDLTTLLALDPADAEAASTLAALGDGKVSPTTAPAPTVAARPGPDPQASPLNSPPRPIVVDLKQDGGTFTAPVEINGRLILDFTVDSGAADVTIPEDVLSTLVRTGTITEADFTGQQTYEMADGHTATARTLVLRSLKVGDKIVQDVAASVAPHDGNLLLGQTFLGQFQSWSIDNGRHALLLVPKSAE
jgi:clan AA aspartic protease (TIGR02281 family)